MTGVKVVEGDERDDGKSDEGGGKDEGIAV